MTAPTRMESALGAFTLNRTQRTDHRSTLQAWDGADLHLLRELAENSPEAGPLLILNDAFGALAVSLSEQTPTVVSDSWLSHEAIRRNCAANEAPPPNVVENHAEWGPAPSTVLIKLPKNQRLLEWQVQRLRNLVSPEARVIAAGMTRNVHRSTLELLERLGPTHTSLAWRKARLAFVTPHHLGAATLPPPVEWTLPETDAVVINEANVFSRDRIDIGTRFLLNHLPTLPGARSIADLGCGSGPLLLAAGLAHPDARLHGFDESLMAIRSAQLTMARNGLSDRFEGHVTDGLTGAEPESFDLILCNPPFHSEHAISRAVAGRMFRQATRALASQGELWVVANRHLGYLKRLRGLFVDASRVAGDRKFDVYRASEPR